ncbi:hypothetical protein AAF712_016876, partial [Marasmius tenuissimus]
MESQPNEILRRILFESANGESISIEACSGEEIGRGMATSFRNISRRWRAVAESLPLWHRLIFTHHRDLAPIRTTFDAAFLGTCLQLARQSRMDLEVTLEVQDKDLYDNEGELLCRALEFVGKWECRWSESAYVSHARASCNVLSMVLEDLRKWGQSWQLFSLDLHDLKEGGEASLMAEICCKIGFMPALDILRLRMDELQHEGPWARYIPTS